MSREQGGEVVDEQDLNHAQAREIINFQMSYQKKRIKATWALAIVIVGIYLLEEYFGGSQNIAVLVRMGANVSHRVVNGEYFRLFSSVFLHAGLMHVFFNTYVLFALGGFFNRILGESKYLTVFFVSGIGGSLASVFFGKSTVSVGASGAIWGLFGASLALAFFKTTLIPEPIRLQLRRITFINLIINLGVSFLPMIDFWAHIGGGIAGFLVSLLIIFPPKTTAFNRLINYLFHGLATILVIVYAAAISYGLWHYAPWTNQLRADLEKVQLSNVPFSMAVPAGHRREDSQSNSRMSSYFAFGNPEIDRVVMEVHFFHENVLGQKADRAWLNKQREELLKETSLSAQVKKTIYFRDTDEGGVLYYQQIPKKSNGVVIHNYVITRNDYAIKIGIMVGEEIKQNDVDVFAGRIIESMEKG